MQFWTKNSQKLDLNITLLNNQITNSTNTKFLGLTIEEMLSWNCHINPLNAKLNPICHLLELLGAHLIFHVSGIRVNQILLRLSLACYAPLMSEDTLKMISYSYVHSIITYSVIFWGNSPHNTDIFKIQKRIIQIMTKSRSRDSCRWLFNRLAPEFYI